MKYILLIKSNLKNSQIITLMISIILDACFSILAIIAVIPLSDVIQKLPSESYSEVTEFTKKILEFFGFNLTNTTASIMFLLANFIRPVSNYYLQYQAIRIKYSVLNSMFSNLIKSIFNSEWRGIEKVTNGVIVNIFTKEIHSLGDGLSLIIMRLIIFVQFLSYICVPLYMDFNLSLTVFIGFLVVVAPFTAFTIIGKKYGYKNLESVNNLVGFISEMTRNLKVFVATNTGNFAFKKFQLYFNDHLSATLRSQLFDKAIGVFFRPFALSVIIIILVYRSSEGSDLTNIIALIWSLISIVPIINTFIQTKLSFSILEPSFLQVERLLKSLSEAAVPSNKVQPVRGNYDITFDNVTCSVGRINLIEKINFKFPKSKITCIVGPSGSGKSTIVELIIGLKSFNAGRILYNGIDAQQIDYFHLRDNLGYVGQDPVKLNGSIRENIFWRKETLNEPELREMIVSSNCEFIWDFPMQLDELLGENSVQLSGGQWQRLSILRAIVSMPKLLILDEATSALDNVSELRVIEGLKCLSWSPTIVMVSHRKGPIDCADKVLNLEQYQ